MRYVHSTPSNVVPNNQREYDACYYELVIDDAITPGMRVNLTKNANGGALKIYFDLTIAKEIDVYLYAGNNRKQGYEELIKGNEPATAGKTYSLPVEKGILIVAIPRESKKETEFSFNYWIEAKVAERTTL